MMGRTHMGRREFLRQAGRAGGAAALIGTTGAGAVARTGAAKTPQQAQARPVRQAQGKPNIVYILADDLGYGDLSCYGQKKFTTPNIDRLAAEGMRFTDHYSGSTVCAPSRCCLMTGLHTGHAFIRGNKELSPEGQHPIPAGTVTVAKLLKAAGYATGMFGKWGLGGPGTEGDPVKQGFDEFFGYNCQRQAHTYYPGHLWHNDQKVPLDGKTYSHDLIVEKALAFVKANRDRPFFCYMPVTIPHASLHVPEDSAAPFRKKFAEFEDVVGRYAGPQIKNPAACFAGMVTRLDGHVGTLLSLLKELGLDEKTIVMFSSDNGPHSEGGHRPAFFDSNGPLRGQKRDLTEGGIRVPLVARWPGKVPAGTTSGHVSAFWDMLPTFCELAGAEAPGSIDGISFVPTLRGGGQQRAHEYLYWEFWERNGALAVRKGDWKAVRVGTATNPDAPMKLYNLKDDLGETTDLAAKHPEIVSALAGIMKAAHGRSEIWDFREAGRGAKATKPAAKKAK